jgi:hypothetical protein
MHRKAGAGDAVGKGRWSGGCLFDKSARLFVDLPAAKAILNIFQTDLFNHLISFPNSSP